MAENPISEALEDEEQALASESHLLASDTQGERRHGQANSRSLPAPASWRPGFLTLLALFIAFRLLTLFLLRPGGFIRDWSDFDTFLGVAALSDYGLYPFLHFWLEWPPLVPWLAVGAYKLSLLFPPWTDQRFWFVLILGTVFVLFETGNFVLLYRIAGRVSAEFPNAVPDDDRPPTADGEEPDAGDELRNTQHLHRTPVPSGRTLQVQVYAARVVVLYALLFAPIYAMLGFFDAIALFFLLLALDLVLKGRLLGSAVSVGAGVVVKITPIIFVPVALRQLWDAAEDRRAALRDGALCLVTVALTVLISLAPFLLIQPVWLLTSARAIAGRSSWETLWALLEGYFGYGVVGGDRLNPAETAFAVHDSSLPWWLITLVFGLFYFYLWTRPADYRQPRHVVALTGLTVTVFLLYSKGYSPQFLVYLLPFVLLLFPDARGVTYSLLLTLLNVLEQPVYFVLVPEALWLLVGVVLARWLVLAALLVEFGWVLWGSSIRWLALPRRYAPAVLAVLVGVGLVTALPSLGRVYAEHRLSGDPAASLIGYLGTEQAQTETDFLLVTDQDFLRRAKPYLAGDYGLRLAGGDRLYEAAPTVADLLPESGKVWAVVGADADSVRRALNAWGRSLAAYDFGEGGRLQLFAPHRQASAAPLPPVARLGNAATIVGYSVEQPARSRVLVTLYWWASRTPNQSYTVFTQVLDGQGNLVAGHDSRPAGGAAPTQTWVPGRVYADAHLIELPADLPSGAYRVVVGMYDFNLNRLMATGPDASVFESNAVPLGEIEVP